MGKVFNSPIGTATKGRWLEVSRNEAIRIKQCAFFKMGGCGNDVNHRWFNVISYNCIACGNTNSVNNRVKKAIANDSSAIYASKVEDLKERRKLDRDDFDFDLGDFDL